MHEHSNHQPAWQRWAPLDALLALGGPILTGAVLGVQQGAAQDQTMLIGLRASLTLPLILLGVTAAMIPALYIATSLAGVAPPARQVGAAVVRGFRACGVIMLGLAAPFTFLLATSTNSALAVLLGGAVTAAGVLAGLRVLFADLFRHPAPSLGEPLLVRFVFTLWSFVALAIGAQMYGQIMAG